MKSSFEVQTRTEDGTCRYFATLKQALSHADSDINVWKISYTLPTGERVRMVREAAENGVSFVLDTVFMYNQ